MTLLEVFTSKGVKKNMDEKIIQIESMTYKFSVEQDMWHLQLPKSQTRVRDVRQLALISEGTEFFVPASVKDSEDLITFSFKMDEGKRKWKDIQKLERHDQLRMLCNIGKLKNILASRITFFLHPDNLVFDENLMPSLIYRGIRDLVPPFDIDEAKFLHQYKCLIIAVFSKSHSFNDLYLGSLNNAKNTEFERKVNEAADFDTLLDLLKKSYFKEKKEVEKKMQFVPKKRFRLYKQLTFGLIALSVILAIPLVYFGFVKIPFQGHLLQAHRDFLSQDYSQVIVELDGEKPENIPDTGKYVLAYSYIKSEKLSDDQKDAILKNVSIKSDPNYLLYWIYNGRGDFERSVDLAKYLDDPQLIMYGFIKQIEKVKNNPDLTGTERENKVQKYLDQYNSYKEKYGLKSLTETENPDSTTNIQDASQSNETGNQESTNANTNENNQKDAAQETIKNQDTNGKADNQKKTDNKK